MKKLVAVLIFFFCSFVAFAQTTNVTATITDSDSTIWINPQWSVQFVPNPNFPQLNSYTINGVSITSNTYSQYLQVSGNGNSSGLISTTLLDNNQILPAGSKYRWVVQSQTSAPATTYLPIVVTGASQSLTSYLSTNAIAPRFAAISNAFGYSDLEISVTPQPGGGYYNVVSFQQRIWNGTAWGGSTQAVSLDPRSFGADFNGASVADASTTNGSNIITCPNSDCNFPSNITGYIIFATLGNGSSCLDNPSITFGATLQTTVASYTNANSITVVGNSNTTGTGTVCLAWFPKDSTTALTSWWAAGGCTGSYQMPVGKTLFSAPIMQNLSGCLGAVNAGLAYPGQTVMGAGIGSTYLMPAPIFNYASIIGAKATNCAVGNLNIEDNENFTIFGLGERATATMANTCLHMMGSASRGMNIDDVGWNARGGGATLIGVYMLGIEDVWYVGGSNYFGSIAMDFANFSQIVISSFTSGNAASVNGVCPFKIESTGQIIISGNGISACTDIEAGGVLSSTGSQFNGASGDSFAVFVNGGKLNLIYNDAINGNGLQMSSSGSVVSATQTIFAGFSGLANTTLYNNGQNTFNGSTVLNGTTNIIPLAFNAAAPTISSGFGTGAAVSQANGPAAFTLNVGTGGTATNGVISLPTATNGWSCQVQDLTTQSTTVFITKQIASTTTSVTIANFSTAGVQAAWTASDSLQVSCFAH